MGSSLRGQGLLTQLLTRFSELIETAPDLVAVEELWRQDLGKAYAAIRSLIRSTGRTSITYPHPTRYGEELAVIHHREGRICAVAEGRGSDGVRIPDSVVEMDKWRTRGSK